MIPVMIGVSLFLGALGLIGVVWGINNKQFDDPDKANSMALYDDESEPPEVSGD